MWKDKIKSIADYIAKHSKIVFPAIVIVAVAGTVSIALSAGNGDRLEQENWESATQDTVTEETVAEIEDEITMVLNEDPAITTLITSFYNAMASGDADTLNSVCDEISIQDMLRYQEKAKYIESYPVLEIYTKPGPEAGSTIVFIYYKVVFADHEEQFPGYTAYYVCTNEQDELYIRRGEISEEANLYIGELMAQDDVVEFNNRITVEYNELMTAHPELLEYLREMDSQVSAAVGVALAQEKAEETLSTEGTDTNATDANGTEAGGEANATENGDAATENTEQPPVEEAPVENVVQYATATTTVNVRASDSEQADKLGKVAGGTQLQVLEQKVNGWSKVVYEGQEGFIKSEFLQLTEAVQSAEGATSIGTVTALSNINIRSSASETAEKLGVLVGGESAQLLANENGWCKISYNGTVGYVKADYVEAN